MSELRDIESLLREVSELRAENAALRELGAAASRTSRARNDEGEAIRALLTLSNAKQASAVDVANNAHAQKLREWHVTRRLVIHPSRGTTAIVCTIDALTLVSDTTQTLMIHNAVAAGNVSVLRVLIEDIGFHPDTRDTVRITRWWRTCPRVPDSTACATPLHPTHIVTLPQMGRTSLHHIRFTPTSWLLPMVRLLLELGADPLAVDYAGASPQDWLMSSGMTSDSDKQVKSEALRILDAAAAAATRQARAMLPVPSPGAALTNEMRAAYTGGAAKASSERGTAVATLGDAPPASGPVTDVVAPVNPRGVGAGLSELAQSAEGKSTPPTSAPTAVRADADGDDLGSGTHFLPPDPLLAPSSGSAHGQRCGGGSDGGAEALPVSALFGRLTLTNGDTTAAAAVGVGDTPHRVAVDSAPHARDADAAGSARESQWPRSIRWDLSSPAPTDRTPQRVTLTSHTRVPLASPQQLPVPLQSPGLGSPAFRSIFASPVPSHRAFTSPLGAMRSPSAASNSRRVWAWYVLLLVDARPPWMLRPARSMSADDSERHPAFASDAATRGRLAPTVVHRRIAVLEFGLKAGCQAKSVRQSVDPLSGYVVAAAVGPVAVEDEGRAGGGSWSPAGPPSMLSPVGSSSSSSRSDSRRSVGGVASAWLADRVQRRMRDAIRAQRCLAECDEGAPAAAAGKGEAAAAVHNGTAASQLDAEEEMLRVACPQRSNGFACEFSALKALQCVVEGREAVSPAAIAEWRAHLERRHGDVGLGNAAISTLEALPVRGAVHVFQTSAYVDEDTGSKKSKKWLLEKRYSPAVLAAACVDTALPAEKTVGDDESADAAASSQVEGAATPQRQAAPGVGGTIGRGTPRATTSLDEWGSGRIGDLRSSIGGLGGSPTSSRTRRIGIT